MFIGTYVAGSSIKDIRLETVHEYLCFLPTGWFDILIQQTSDQINQLTLLRILPNTMNSICNFVMLRICVEFTAFNTIYHLPNHIKAVVVFDCILHRNIQQYCFLYGNNIDGLMQDCSISIANALDILQSCTKPYCYDYFAWNYDIPTKLISFGMVHKATNKL